VLDDPALAAFLPRLAPYARYLVARSGRTALRIHADEVGPEHLLLTLMEDQDCAAHRAVLFAFADPETVGEEALALAAGILVSGSAASLPFSPGGVRALRRARELAAGRQDVAVRQAHLLLASARELPAEVAEELESSGFDSAGLLASLGEGGSQSIGASGPLFRHFTEGAKRLLSAAARSARQESADSIGPAHVLLACLAGEPALEEACGVSAARARVVLRGRTRDESPVEARTIAADEALIGYLAGLPGPPGACTSLGLLARFHGGGTPELAQLLSRHKVTPALLARVGAAFRDPDSAPAP
jgi:ATP-dependent Clp protease ATP-binding subunit ClpA